MQGARSLASCTRPLSNVIHFEEFDESQSGPLVHTYIHALVDSLTSHPLHVQCTVLYHGYIPILQYVVRITVYTLCVYT